jgi:ABC-type multidrug transport system ATPase subunit
MRLEFDRLSKFYGDQAVIRNASGVIQGYEKVLFSGPNGSGKSTLLRILSAQVPASSGSLLLNSKRLTARERGSFSIVGGERFLYRHLSMQENLQLYLGDKWGTDTVFRVCEEFGLSLKSTQPLKNLSAGQAQKVALVKAFLMEREILVFDEPLNFLDKPSREAFFRYLHGVSSMVLLASHEIDEFVSAGFRHFTLVGGVLGCP